VKKVNRILIIDDDIANILLAKKVLKNFKNADIIYAQDAQEGIEVLKEEDIDLILLDIEMPNLDGFDTCKIIKEDKKLRDIPIIFLTSRSSTDDIVKAFSLGGVDYIIKPFNAPEMLARIKTHLNLRSLQKRMQEEINRILDDMLEQEKHSKKLKKHIISYKSKAFKNVVETKTTAQMIEQELEQKNRQIKLLEDELDKETDETTRLENANRELRMENSSLKLSLEKLKENVAVNKLQNDIDKLKTQNKALQEEIKALEAKIISLEGKDMQDIDIVENELQKQKVTRWHQRNG